MQRGTRHLSVRRRIVVIFLVSVLFPGLILGYFVLKSIKQEKISQQQLILQNLQSSLSLAIERIETNFEDEVRSIFASPSLQMPAFNSRDAATLRELSDRYDIVEQVFLVDETFRLIFPRTFYSRGIRRSGLPAVLVGSVHVERGERFEAEGRYDDALKEFELALTPELPVVARMGLLSRVARCQFKGGNFPEAQETYRKILTEDRNRFYGEGIPYSLVAYNQLLSIVESEGSSETAVNLLVEFGRALSENFDRLDRNQWEYYLERVESKLERLVAKGPEAHRDTLARLHELSAAVLRENEQSAFFQSAVLPRIQSVLSSEKTLDRVRYFALTSGDSTLHGAFETRGTKPGPIRIVGFTIRRSTLDDLTARRLAEVRIGEPMRAVLLDEHETPVLTAGGSVGSILFKSPFRSLVPLLPGDSVGVVAYGRNPLEAITSKSLTIYYVFIGLVILMIVFGIVLIFHDISREEDLSRMKSDFIANVSHEIKTPIASIRTLAENLNEGWIVDKTKQREYYRHITKESERLSHLVENILDFSRIEAEKKSYRMDLVSPVDVVKRTVERFRVLVDGQGVTLKASIPLRLPHVKMDQDAIQQALLNLLDNAVKYSREEKCVEISAEALSDQLVIRVADHGRGISKKEVGKIFEKFYRIESQNERKVPGSGIGLTLVKEIIEAHGGRVELKSEVNQGSTFTLFIPVTTKSVDGDDPPHRR